MTDSEFSSEEVKSVDVESVPCPLTQPHSLDMQYRSYEAPDRRMLGFLYYALTKISTYVEFKRLLV